MEVLGGRRSLESRYRDASRQWRVTRLLSAMAGVSTCPFGKGVVPQTEIEMNSKVGLTAKRSKKGGNSTPKILMSRLVRDVKERSFLSKSTSRDSDRMVDISPKSGGRSGNSPCTEPVTSMITSVMTGEGTVSLKNNSDNPRRPDVLKHNVLIRLRLVGS